MKNNDPKYDPENIESLLQNKSFGELTASEKDFVLQHISSPEEYAEMRSFLGNLKTSFSGEMEIEPDAGVKNLLMEQFHKTHAKPKRSPLSGIIESLFPSGRSVLLSPGFQIAGIAVLIFGTVFFINRQNTAESDRLAIHPNKTEELPAPAESETRSDEALNAGASANEIVAEEQSKNDVAQTKDEKKLFESPVSVEEMDLSTVARPDRVDDRASGFATDSTYFLQQKKESNTIIKTEAEVNSSTAYSSSEIANDLDRNEISEKTVASTKSTSAKNKKSDIQSGVESQSHNGKTVLHDLLEKKGKETPGKSAAEQPELLELLFTSL